MSTKLDPAKIGKAALIAGAAALTIGGALRSLNDDTIKTEADLSSAFSQASRAVNQYGLGERSALSPEAHNKIFDIVSGEISRKVHITIDANSIIKAGEVFANGKLVERISHDGDGGFSRGGDTAEKVRAAGARYDTYDSDRSITSGVVYEALYTATLRDGTKVLLIIERPDRGGATLNGVLESAVADGRAETKIATKDGIKTSWNTVELKGSLQTVRIPTSDTSVLGDLIAPEIRKDVSAAILISNARRERASYLNVK